VALSEISLEILRGELFGILGPNGSGKSTLFRLLSTLLRVQQGSIEVAGFATATHAAEVRRAIGVVFQSSCLDRKLTVAENLQYQGALYGLSGSVLAQRVTQLLEQFQLRDRATEPCEKLSGGLRRRVELAKGMLHKPAVLLLDEPSTGLDPAARLDLWQALVRLREEQGTTVVLTTHLLDEAAKADRLAIFDQGALVALDTPGALQQTVGGETIFLRGPHIEPLAEEIALRFALTARAVAGEVRVEVPSDGHLWIPRLVEAYPGRVHDLALGRPTLEDVFIARTGHRFASAGEES
jgi:ABC-2 type transport system ATP-binding protein